MAETQTIEYMGSMGSQWTHDGWKLAVNWPDWPRKAPHWHLQSTIALTTPFHLLSF